MPLAELLPRVAYLPEDDRETLRHAHQTPMGGTQHFQFSLFRRD